MSKASLELGGGNWGTKDGNLLAYAQGNESSNLVPREFTFTRGSDIAATRVDVNGLIEKGRENLLTYSNYFSGWSNVDVTYTSGQSGYDGSNNAWLYDGNLGYSYQIQSRTGVITFSVYAKAGSADGIRLRLDEAAPTQDVNGYFNLVTGTIINLTGSGAIDSNIESVGGGWYRCSVTMNAVSLANVRLYVIDDAGVSVVGTIYIQDAQLEAGLVATSYLESGATTATSGVADNEPRINYAGGTASLLLEPSRTNIATYSEYMLGFNKGSASSLEANAAISPDGKSNATYFYCNTTTTNAYLLPSFSGTSGVQYAVSFYAKAKELNRIYIKNVNDSGSQSWFDLSDDGTYNLLSGIDSMSIELAGDGWYRCTAVSTSTTTGIKWIPILKGDANEGVYVYGLQIEQASYSTSYIPTYGTSVTRSFDYSIVESLGYSSTCTFYYEFNTTTGREASSPFAEVGKDTSNKFYIKGASTNNPQFQIQGNGIFSGSISPTNEISGINKIAVQWSSGVGVVFCNGVKQSGTLANSNTSENIDFIAIKGEGTLHDSKKLLFFPTAITDRELVDLTSPYSTYQELVTAEGLTWESPTCTTNSITELQSI